MGSIRQRTNQNGGASFHAQVRLTGHPPVTATFTRKSDAKRWIQKTESDIREGRHFERNEAKRHTLADLVGRYLDALSTKRPEAYEKQKQLLGWWEDQLGAYSLANVTPALLAERRDRLLAENLGTDKKPRRRSPATANRYLAALSKAFTVSVREWHWLSANPVLRVQKEREPPGRVRYLSQGERDRLLTACRSSPLSSLELIVMLALTTGMRRGEILGLRWPDVDLGRAVAVLQKTKNQDRRSVPLVPPVLELLQAHGCARRLETDLVFTQTGKSKPVQIDHWFRLALKQAKIEDFRFHDLRHTAASYLAMSGATTPEIAAVLGHRTLQMVKRYAHLSDAHTGEVVRRMTEKFFGG